jgi:hypothetical protein
MKSIINLQIQANEVLGWLGYLLIGKECDRWDF